MRIRDLGLAYAKSLTVALAAGAPLGLATWNGIVGPQMGFLALLGLSLAGVCCWLLALPLVRHPFWQELRLLLAHLGKLRTARP